MPGQLARYDLTAADADAFVQQTAPAAVGRAAQYAILVNDKDLAFGALGTVDEGYLSCGQLQLLSGRLPGHRRRGSADHLGAGQHRGLL